MKAYTSRLTTASLLALASVSTTSLAQSAAPAFPTVPVSTVTVDPANAVYLAPIDADDRTLRRYTGFKLVNLEGAEFGTVRDFVINPATNRVRYAVISSGGVLGGIGNRLRLVPVEALRRGRGNTFEVDLLQSTWLQTPPITDDAYVGDRFDITPPQHHEMVQRFRTLYAQPQTLSTGDLAGLVRASPLRGKPLRNFDRTIGNIDDIVINLENGTAAALLSGARDFTGVEARYLVPLSRLTLQNIRQNGVVTSLTRTDFDRAQPAAFVITTPPAQPVVRVNPEPPLPPTGRPTREVIATATNNTAAAATAVRQAISSDPYLAAEDLHVVIEGDRVVLRGTVRSEAAKANLQNVVRRANPTATVESQVAVVPR